MAETPITAIHASAVKLCGPFWTELRKVSAERSPLQGRRDCELAGALIILSGHHGQQKLCKLD